MKFKVANVFLAILVASMCVSMTGAIAHDEEYRGVYHWGHEVNDFVPCGSKKVYAVSASSWVVVPLYDDVNDKIKDPYKAVYIEFRGHMLDEIRDGFAIHLDGLIRISEIRSYSINIPSECYSRSTRPSE